MREKRNFNRRARLLWFCLILPYITLINATAQQQGKPGERGSVSDAYDTVDASTILRNRRPGRSVQRRVYRTSRAFPARSSGDGKTFMTVGVTISRGRIATDAEINHSDVAKVKGCVRWEVGKCADRKDMVLVRISDESTVSDKEQIQLAIEYLAFLDASGDRQSNRIGYLYVVNRELYQDGIYSKPKLIFPTLNTYGGDNRVLPGKTVVMPEPERPWTVSRSGSGKVQAFETYTIIVSPEPLKDSSGREIQPEATSFLLDEKLFASWVNLWGGGAERGDLENGAGQLIMQSEVKASGSLKAKKRSTDDEADDLKLDDPPPQIIFSKAVNPDGRMLVTVRLPYREAAASAQTPNP